MVKNFCPWPVFQNKKWAENFAIFSLNFVIFKKEEALQKLQNLPFLGLNCQDFLPKSCLHSHQTIKTRSHKPPVKLIKSRFQMTVQALIFPTIGIILSPQIPIFWLFKVMLSLFSRFVNTSFEPRIVRFCIINVLPNLQNDVRNFICFVKISGFEAQMTHFKHPIKPISYDFSVFRASFIERPTQNFAIKSLCMVNFHQILALFVSKTTFMQCV